MAASYVQHSLPEPEERPLPEVLTVGQVTKRIKETLGGFGRVAVEGEISGLKRAGSGHVYFSLKDADAVLACALWRSRVAKAVRFELQEGMSVVCHGKLDVYAPRGAYNLSVERMEQRGIGELLARLEELKAELKGRGWFDRTRPLPDLPTMVGIVTSRSGAALTDFLRTRSRRWPRYPVRLAHSTVQGPGAATEIAAALDRLVESGVDLVVLARGGGSLEDLWAFNELPLAEAIWRSPIPVVSAVGHESDFTLADMVADHRAHTPTDGAQRVIPERELLFEGLDRLGGQLADGLGQGFLVRRRRLDELGRVRVLAAPDWLISDRRRALGGAGQRLGLASRAALLRDRGRLGGQLQGLARHTPALELARRGARLAALGPRLTAAARRCLELRGSPLGAVGRTLEATSPYAVLARGYSITRAVTADGGEKPLAAAGAVEPGAQLETVLHRGRLISKVEAVLPQGDRDGRPTAEDGEQVKGAGF
ncbi:MAG TPA: exodeoxyribonuclease VII large subunit [Planctomycetota bacterium]|nr:exodeoxyribonuclease VII large subunit [Planctomycetota bacterium]